MEVIVKYHPSVQQYFNTLIENLFYENYFSHRERAEEYVSRLLYLVENNIDKKIHHLTPPLIASYGTYYISIYLNAKTTWYFVFESNANRYLITFVFNNYSKEAVYLI